MKHLEAIGTLKKILKVKKVRYKDLASTLEISEVSVKRAFSEGNMSLERFVKICEVADVDWPEVFSMSKTQGLEHHTYTDEQEKYFAKNIRALAYFDQLLLFRSPLKIKRKFKLTDSENRKFLAGLDKIGLIQWLPGDKAKILVPENIYWQSGGILRKHFMKMIKTEFIEAPFDQKGELFSLAMQDMSPESEKKACQMLNDTLDEIDQMCKYDKDFAPRHRKNGLLVAFRPWNFSKLEEI